MMRTPGVKSGAWWSRWAGRATARSAGLTGYGLTGYRYLLAVAVLVALASAPMLVAVVAGAATLSDPPPGAGATPFVTYSGTTSSPGCPGLVGSP